jgi:outer membrane protein TolC
MRKMLLMLVWWPLPVGAQDPMSLKDAVHLALDKNKSVEASVAARRAAESHIAAARGGNLPKVNYSELWARSDNPVFVFSSLLTQHQFGEQNFQIGPLNRPDFLNNFQSQVTADQTLYDAGQTRHAARSAELAKDITSEEGVRLDNHGLQKLPGDRARGPFGRDGHVHP